MNIMVTNTDRRRPLSLNTRVMLFVAFAIGFSLLLIGYLVQHALEHHFAEQDADELVVITNAVVSALSKADKDGLPAAETLVQAVSGHHGVYFQVWDADNKLLYGDYELRALQQATIQEPLSQIRAGNLYHWSLAGKSYNGAITQTHIGERVYRIVTAINMDFHLHFLTSFGQTLWLIMLLAGASTLLAAWFGVHQGHAPLRRLSKVIHDVRPDGLHIRLEPATLPAELQQLAASFNAMIERLEDSFSRLADFSADIAHELRTPLTNIITQTQVVLGKSRSQEQYRELHYSNLEELERLAKMVNEMLWLAQSEQGLLKPGSEPVNVAREIQELFEFFEALVDEKRIRMMLEGQAPVLLGDRAMLRRAFSNLLSNAIRYTAEGGTVLVQLGSLAGGGGLIQVCNPGPDIPAAQLPRLFDRFYRGDPARQRNSDGAGLGLAIVKSIVDAHDGTIEVTSAEGQTCFSLRLPSGY